MPWDYKMYKVVILGASYFAYNLALRLRQEDSSLFITLVSNENFPIYERRKLIDFVGGSLKEEELFFCPEEFYKENNIEFLKGKEFININTTKRLVYLKDKDKIEYDFLIIATESTPRLPEIPGIRKREVYNFYFLDEVKRFLKQFIIEPVCVVGSDRFALDMAEKIAKKYNTEVKLISRVYFNSEVIPQNIEVIRGSLEQIIGEGRVQAIKLKEGKVIAVCAVIFMDNCKPYIEFLKNTPIKLQDDFVLVDEFLRTTVENVFCIGDIAKRIDPEDICILLKSLWDRIKKGA